MNRTYNNQIKSKPETALLNEIAHLTSLLQCSKSSSKIVKAQNIQRKTKTIVHQKYRLNWHNGTKLPSKRSSFTKSKTRRSPISPSLLSVPSRVFPSSGIVAKTRNYKCNAVPPAQIIPFNETPSVVSGQSSAAAPATTGNKIPSRYFTMLPQKSPIKKIVQRRLPPDLVEISYSDGSGNKDVQATDDNDGKHLSSIDSQLKTVTCQNRVEQETVVGDMKISGLEQPDQSSRRNRILTKINKLSSYKERLAGDKVGQSTMPFYFPC